MQKRRTKRSGVTLIELMVTILLASIGFVAIGMVLADAIRGYKGMFTRIHGDIVNDAYVSRVKFDKVCRRASAGSATVSEDSDGNSMIQVLYYSVPNVSGGAYLESDMYAQFYLNETDLMLVTGMIAGGAATPETVASNVAELKFSEVHSKSVQMVLTLSKEGGHSMTITCGSIMHN